MTGITTPSWLVSYEHPIPRKRPWGQVERRLITVPTFHAVGGCAAGSVGWSSWLGRVVKVWWGLLQLIEVPGENESSVGD